jgi:hypothetical protein
VTVVAIASVRRPASTMIGEGGDRSSHPVIGKKLLAYFDD